MKYQIVIFFSSVYFILHFNYNLFAQDSDKINLNDSVNSGANKNAYAERMKIDNPDTTIYTTSFTNTSDSVNAYKADKNFGYIYYLDSILKHKKITVDTVSSESFREKYTRKRSSEKNSQPGSNPANNYFNNFFIRIILWLTAFCFIGAILYKLFLSDGIFMKSSVQQNTDPSEEAENALEISAYDGLVNNAVLDKNFRLAVRYLYLQTLQKLFAANLLQFSPDKTNQQYVTELNYHSNHKEFTSLTRLYEYVWYGNFDISEKAYSSIKKDFKQYHQKI